MDFKVVHLSTSDLNGGAAIAAFRIHNAQLKSGINSKFLVQSKLSDNSSVISLVQSPLDKIKYRVRSFGDKLFAKTLSITDWDAFTFPYFGLDVSGNDIVKESDILILHQTCSGFLSLNSISKLTELKKPIIFTLHDMWPFTGGCHYNNYCENYYNQCGICPQLKSSSGNDFSFKIHKRKKSIYKKLNLNIVTSSNWLNKEAEVSSLLGENSIKTIYTPIDTDTFKPRDKLFSRRELSLQPDKTLILIGAMNLNIKRKGIEYLISALKIINKDKPELIKNLDTIIFGSLDESILSEIPFKVHQLGKINDENKLVDCYNAADIYVTPSLQDNLPNTVIESLSCGTPVVAFNTGGMPDMIEHLENGYLAELKSSNDLAAGMVTLLSDTKELLKMKEKCRDTALEKFNEETIANQYSAYYKELLAEQTNAPNP